ncbi:MAG: right-handed parallel beta-helix repeat-containing protein [Thermoguttaceae bacterium]
MKKQLRGASTTNRTSLRAQAAIAVATTMLTLLACVEAAADDSNPHPYAMAQPGTASQLGLVEASGLQWLHLSSRNDDLPVPTTSRQQTAAVVADLAEDGLNGFVLAFHEKGPARAARVVGDPAQSAALPAALLTAYQQGARDLTIAPGTYKLPNADRNGIQLVGWHDATIHAIGVTIIFEDAAHRPVLLKGCSNVLLEGATLQFAGISFTQGRIKAIGADAKGKYCDWQIDAGYPTNIRPNRSTFNVIDRQTRLLKVGTGDCDAREAEALGAGLIRLRQARELLARVAVGDWLVTRALGGSSIVQLDGCKGCTMKEVTLRNSGFAAFFETGGEGGHRYLGCRVARGPKPPGATEEPLISCGADGFHSAGTRIGPTFERCTWEGVLLDDCIAIHGSFQKVIRAEGTTLILERGNRGNFAVNEPVRISSNHGFFGQAKCVALRNLRSPENVLELTLDHAMAAPADAKAGNPERCGKGYKILDCTLGNTRSRGILVKGDDGIIQGCTIEGCGMSAVSIGPEYWWNEADYCWKVTVAGNTFRHNVVNGSEAGVVLVHGDGAIGNRNVAIHDNHFEKNYGLFMINTECTEGLKISGNVIQSPSLLPLPRPSSIINLVASHDILLQGNLVSKPGPSAGKLVNLGNDVEGLRGNDASGIRLEK